MRPCELAAIAVLDRLFLAGAIHNEDYASRRARACIIAVNCHAPAATCCCTSMGSGPAASQGYDLALTEIVTPQEHWFLLAAGSDQGLRLLAQLPLAKADARALAAAEATLAQAAAAIARRLDKSVATALKHSPRHELRGCPIDKHQLLEVVAALLQGRRPQIPTHSVCLECKARHHVCLLVAQGKPCLGPLTQAGCGALCPAYGRPCYGCFGPMEAANGAAFSRPWADDLSGQRECLRALNSYNAAAPAFAAAANAITQEGCRDDDANH